MREIDDAAEREDQRQAEGDEEKGRAGKEAVHNLLEDKDQLHVRLVQGWAGGEGPKDPPRVRFAHIALGLDTGFPGATRTLREDGGVVCLDLPPHLTNGPDGPGAPHRAQQRHHCQLPTPYQAERRRPRRCRSLDQANVQAFSSRLGAIVSSGWSAAGTASPIVMMSH
jgi:hypothetical protein